MGKKTDGLFSGEFAGEIHLLNRSYTEEQVSPGYGECFIRPAAGAPSNEFGVWHAIGENQAEEIFRGSNEECRRWRDEMESTRDAIRRIPPVINDLCGKDKDFLLGNAYPALNSQEFHSDYLFGKPHTGFLDMEVSYEVRCERDGLMFIMPITWEMLEKLGIGTDDVHEAAMANLSEEKFELKDQYPGSPVPLFSLRAEGSEGHGGAAIILRQDMLEYASETMGGDFTVIPSSVDEVLLTVPPNDQDVMEIMNSKVREVNASVVPNGMALSSHVYVYDSKSRKLTMPADFLKESEAAGRDRGGEGEQAQAPAKRRGR